MENNLVRNIVVAAIVIVVGFLFFMNMGDDANEVDGVDVTDTSIEVTSTIGQIDDERIKNADSEPGNWLAYGRTYEEGKKINWKDGVRALHCILKYNIFTR